MIVADPRNDKAWALQAALQPHLEGSEGEVMLVIGGDGFMLRTIADYGFERLYLGLNAGHLGFLLNDVNTADIAGIALAIREERYVETSYPTLEARILKSDGEIVVERAVNDVYLERSTGQAARLGLTIDGHCVVDSMVADGLIFATALGSTAYSYSAGGTPLHPTLNLLQVTAICPHLPRLAPMGLPPTSHARVEVRMPQRRPVRAVADGRAVEEVREVTITYSPESVRLAYFDGHDFTAKMLEKILRT